MHEHICQGSMLRPGIWINSSVTHALIAIIRCAVRGLLHCHLASSQTEGMLVSCSIPSALFSTPCLPEMVALALKYCHQACGLNSNGRDNTPGILEGEVSVRTFLRRGAMASSRGSLPVRKGTTCSSSRVKRSFTLSSPFHDSRCVLRSMKHTCGSPSPYHLHAPPVLPQHQNTGLHSSHLGVTEQKYFAKWGDQGLSSMTARPKMATTDP